MASPSLGPANSQQQSTATVLTTPDLHVRKEDPSASNTLHSYLCRHLDATKSSHVFATVQFVCVADDYEYEKGHDSIDTDTAVTARGSTDIADVNADGKEEGSRKEQDRLQKLLDSLDSWLTAKFRLEGAVDVLAVALAAAEQGLTLLKVLSNSSKVEEMAALLKVSDCLMAVGKGKTAVMRGQEAAQQCNETGDVWAGVMALQIVAAAQLQLGKRRESLRTAKAAKEALGAKRNDSLLARALRDEGAALAVLEDYDEAITRLKDAASTAVSAGDLATQASIKRFEADVHINRSNFKEALSAARDALEISERQGDKCGTYLHPGARGKLEFFGIQKLELGQSAFAKKELAFAEDVVASGGWHSCALRPSGEVICWGANDQGQSTPPKGTFVSLAAGKSHSCGIRPSGLLECWGSNSHHQTEPPDLELRQVACGAAHTCALASDGEIHCWGSDEHQRSSGSPSGRFVSIAASGGHSCALKKNGNAVCWGFNDNNQTDVPKAKFRQIAPGYLHTCALTLQDEVLCWGQRRGDNKPPPGRFQQVSSRGPFSCALDMAGRAVCWPQAEQRDDHFVHISVGGSHFCGVQESGHAKCRGKDDQGQSSPPSGFFKLPTKKTHPKSTEL
ncbi:CCR3 [Symbiodinium sp. CCMP2592]|nr:CCR3 [Symbiodinium sp. CCMP2592]